jgi:hypothetical protein
MQPFDNLVSNEMTQRSTSAAIDGANGEGVVNYLANDGKGKQGGVLPRANPPPPPPAAADDPPPPPLDIVASDGKEKQGDNPPPPPGDPPPPPLVIVASDGKEKQGDNPPPPPGDPPPPPLDIVASDAKGRSMRKRQESKAAGVDYIASFNLWLSNKDMKATVTVATSVGDAVFTPWFNPKENKTAPTSPYLFVSNKQRVELLHRSVPIAAVAQKGRGGIARAWVCPSGLMDQDGDLVGYLMLIFRFNCNSKPPRAQIVLQDDDNSWGMMEFEKLTDLYPYNCDPSVEIPAEAQSVFDAHYTKKMWKEEGFIKPNGDVQRKYLLAHGVWDDEPDDVEPGM